MTREGTLLQEREAFQDSLADSEKEKDTWFDLCTKGLANMKYLEEELEREKEEREHNAATFAAMRGLKEELEREKEMREHDGRAADGRILEVQDQVAKEVEERKKLLVDNHSAECRILELENQLTKEVEEHQDTKEREELQKVLRDFQDANSRVLELEAQLSIEREEHRQSLSSKEVECEYLRLKVEESEKDQVVALAGEEAENEALLQKIDVLENEKVGASVFVREGTSLWRAIGDFLLYSSLRCVVYLFLRFPATIGIFIVVMKPMERTLFDCLEATCACSH